MAQLTKGDIAAVEDPLKPNKPDRYIKFKGSEILDNEIYSKLRDFYRELYGGSPWNERLSDLEVDSRLRYQLGNDSSLAVLATHNNEVVSLATAQIKDLNEGVLSIANEVTAFLSNNEDVEKLASILAQKLEYIFDLSKIDTKQIVLMEEFGIDKNYRSRESLTNLAKNYIGELHDRIGSKKLFLMWTLSTGPMNSLSNALGFPIVTKVYSEDKKIILNIYAGSLDSLYFASRNDANFTVSLLLEGIKSGLLKGDWGKIIKFAKKTFRSGK